MKTQIPLTLNYNPWLNAGTKLTSTKDLLSESLTSPHWWKSRWYII